MAHHMPATTLLVKGCPDPLLDVVVSAIEKFGFARSILAVPPNVTLDQAPQQSNMAHCTHVIYMKAAHDVGAEAQLRSFVETELNLRHDSAMYCIEVKPRNYPVHFTLLLSHVKGPPARTAIQQLFETFGKCNVRVKDHSMTYINFPRYEQVVLVLEARNQAKLVLNDMVVLVDELIPVQNAKLMISLEMLLKDRRAAILECKCITKHNLCTWFNTAKKNESCDKTWEQLVDFVANCINVTFGWTYNSNEEIFEQMPQPCTTSSVLTDDTVVVPTAPCAAVAAAASKLVVLKDVSGMRQNALVLESMEPMPPCGDSATCTVGSRVQGTGADGAAADDSDGLCQTLFHEAIKWENDTSVSANMHMEEQYKDAGVVLEAGTTEVLDGADDLEYVPCDLYPVVHGVVDKQNYLPLYGEESHPLHHRLCFFEVHIFGRTEDSNTSIQYRLNNMEMLLNVQNDMHPLSVRLTLLEYWTKQYLDVMRTVPTVQLDAS
jgi:hypothetical protein